MTDLDKLRSEYETAMDKAHQLTRDKDEAMQKVRDRYFDRQRDANQKAAETQKALADAEAAAALVGRDDAETVAANLGLTLPED
jgi:hypothetical protein